MNVRNFFWRAFLLFVFTIPLSQFISVRLLLILVFISFFIKSEERGFFRFLRDTWDFALYLLVLAIGLIYTQDLTTGLSVMETNFGFLAIPIVLSRLAPIDRTKLNGIFQAFKFGLLTASLICLSVATYHYFQQPDIQIFFFYKFTEVIHFDPTYFAYYLIFAISVELFNIYYYDTNSSESTIKLLTILFLFLVLILTGGQTAFVGVLFVFSFFILKFLIEKKTPIKKIAIAAIIVMLSCLFLISVLEKEFEYDFNDSWERAVLWESAISAIPNLFLGVGTGDYKLALNDYYMKNGLVQFATESYNSHNQAIQILFSNGILGLICFGCMIIRPLVQAGQNKNVLTILCFFPFLVYGMTEAFLGRYQGIVFFALLHQVFVLTMQTEKSFSTRNL